jgi:Protein kinase domain/Putative zinc-finger
MGCLDANAVQQLMSGAMAPAQRDEVNAHLDGCSDCRQLVALVARGLAATDPVGLGATLPSEGTGHPPPSATGILAAGTQVGRYLVTDMIGAGGMGVVYAADDPELDRRVAIKLLRRDLRAAFGEARLQREAQAMARISHQNVIAVHDVGSHADQVFVAMELVDGHSLRAWLRARARSVGGIVSTFAAAGRGLAAAHAAGLVHRDFKPDNVLVDADDGRVRVTDFGLARAADDRADAGGGARDDAIAIDRPLTVSGAVIGTPAYMAPEQLAGGHVDARTDQFSFCVALYEALYGERPFAGKHLAELEAEVAAGRVRPPPARTRSRVPASLRAIVLRGLSVRPGDRFSTMDDLVAALGRDRTRVPRTVAWLALALAAIAGVGLFADWIVRDRALATTRISFRAASDQLGRSAALRYQVFVAMADQSYVVDLMRSVTGNRDQADFGLGPASSDQATLTHLHELLADASFITWAKEISRGVIAVADYKGRLLYTSAAPRTWGKDVFVLPAARRAFERGDAAMAARGGDPVLVDSGLFGDTPREGVWVVYAHALEFNDVPRGLFMQAVEGERLLSDVSVGEGIRLGLVAPDGAMVGPVPGAVARAGLAAGTDDDLVTVGGDTWLVESRPLAGLSDQAEIARMVLARPIDVGLAGLFAGARAVLGILTAGLLALALAGALIARRAGALRT